MPKNSKLLLDLEGETITAGKFLEAARAFFALADEVAEEISGKRNAVTWSVAVEPGSVHLEASPFACKAGVPAERIMSVVSAGLRHLEKSATRPPHFSDKALTLAGDLAAIPDGKTVIRTAVRHSRGKRTSAPITLLKTARHVREILGPTIQDFGTIEGYLRTISIQGGSHFTLFDSLTEESVRCNMGEAYLDSAWKILRDRCRVAVSGMINYRKTGRPTSITVEGLQPLGQGAPVKAKDVLGILNRAT